MSREIINQADAAAYNKRFKAILAGDNTKQGNLTDLPKIERTDSRMPSPGKLAAVLGEPYIKGDTEGKDPVQATPHSDAYFGGALWDLVQHVGAEFNVSETLQLMVAVRERLSGPSGSVV